MELETIALRSVPDDVLLHRLGELVSRSRRVEADLVAHIGEVDARRLFARFAFPSMFAYCTDHLHLSEAEAYRRLTVARASRKYPFAMGGTHDVANISLLCPAHNRHMAERDYGRSAIDRRPVLTTVSP